MRLQSDESLVALTRGGHQDAFEALVRRYRPRLIGFCAQMLGSKAGRDAEDVVQEALVAAYTAMIADERPIEVRPWLYRIARNRCLNHLRGAAAATSRPASGDGELDILARQAADSGLSAADQAGRREDLRRLIREMRELPESQRSALILRELEAMSYQQVADAMSTSVPSVKSLLVRARVSLRRNWTRSAAALSPLGVVGSARRLFAGGLSGGGGAVATKAATVALVAGTVFSVGADRSVQQNRPPSPSAASATPVEELGAGAVATAVSAEPVSSPAASSAGRRTTSSASAPAGVPARSATHGSGARATRGVARSAPSRAGASATAQPDIRCGGVAQAVSSNAQAVPSNQVAQIASSSAAGAAVDRLCRTASAVQASTPGDRTPSGKSATARTAATTQAAVGDLLAHRTKNSPIELRNRGSSASGTGKQGGSGRSGSDG